MVSIWFAKVQISQETTHFVFGKISCMAILRSYLSFDNNVEHYRVQGKSGKLTIDDEVFFNSLEELIQVSHIFSSFVEQILF
jgi:hypothetical protein